MWTVFIGKEDEKIWEKDAFVLLRHLFIKLHELLLLMAYYVTR